MRLFGQACFLAMVLGASGTVTAQEGFGEAEYMNSCAQCHGADGTGSGPMAGYLTTSLPDLTMLSADNGGIFPVERVYEVVDGRAEIGPHGSREMPAWGMRYTYDAEARPMIDYAPAPEAQARVRILSLIEYLADLQK